MNKNVRNTVTIGILLTIAIAGALCAYTFDTPFSKNTIDYFSFIAALFLIIDGFYKIRRYKSEPYFPNHFVRHLRIVIGACIFTIHTMQFIYGV